MLWKGSHLKWLFMMPVMKTEDLVFHSLAQELQGVFHRGHE